MLIVHGISRRQEGATLRVWSDEIQSWVDRWVTTRGGRRVAFGDTIMRSDGAKAPPRAYLRWPDRNWLLAECFWDDVVNPPGARQVGVWAVGLGTRLSWRYGMRRLTTVLRAFGSTLVAAGPKWSFAKMLAITILRLLLLGPAFVVVLAAVVAIAVVANAALLGAVLFATVGGVFFPPLRKSAASAALMLSDVLGDAYLLRRSASTRAAMRTRLIHRLEFMADHCDDIVIVAHSQGAVIAHEALTLLGTSQVSVVDPEQVRLLVTVGAGFKPLSEIGDNAEFERSLALEHPPWVDFYATSDPVSDGPLWQERRPATSTQVQLTNGASWLRDHSTYLANREQFLACLVQCLVGAERTGDGRDPVLAFSAADRGFLRAAYLDRVERVDLLKVARVATALGLSCALWMLWSDLPAIGRDAIELGGGKVPLGLTPTPRLVGVAAVAAGAAVLYVLQLFAFAWAGAKELAALLDGRLGGYAAFQGFAMLVVPAVLIVLAVATAEGDLADTALGAMFVFLGGLVLLVEMMADSHPEVRLAAPLTTAEAGVGAHLAMRDGHALSHVEVVEPGPDERERTRFFRRLAGEHADARTIEVLDEPPTKGNKGTRPLPLGERLIVSGLANFPCTWASLQAAGGGAPPAPEPEMPPGLSGIGQALFRLSGDDRPGPE